jgi:hypothetical protein
VATDGRICPSKEVKWRQRICSEDLKSFGDGGSVHSIYDPGVCDLARRRQFVDSAKICATVSGLDQSISESRIHGKALLQAISQRF